MYASALHGRKGHARGAKSKTGLLPGEALQQSAGPFWQQPEGNGRPGAPLSVAFLAQTPGLRFVKRLDWHPMPPVRTCGHSVNRSTMSELAQVRHGRVLNEKMRIGGKLVGGDRVIEVRNPYTSAVVGTVPQASVDDIRSAFAIAKKYKPSLTRHDRYRISHRAAELIRGRSAEISDLITAESGLCKKDSLYEVGRACDVFV